MEASTPEESTKETDTINSQLNLLLVEDTLTQSMYMSHALGQAGYQVTLARSGEKALEALETFRPDAMLTDINMPGISGFDLVRKLKEDDSTQGITAILLLTPANLKDAVEILNSGADGIVFKSTLAKKFVEQVKLALQQGHSSALKIGDLSHTTNSTLEKSNHLFLSAYQQILDLQSQ
ncbi:response regulator [bacterium]|jgi:DNA-binding response OmpR family regulator|nr:response regulator [bacterium]MBP9093087.1 response regulator [bacterium]MBP9811017.1 response regulator [bacterium]